MVHLKAYFGVCAMMALVASCTGAALEPEVRCDPCDVTADMIKFTYHRRTLNLLGISIVIPTTVTLLNLITLDLSFLNQPQCLQVLIHEYTDLCEAEFPNFDWSGNSLRQSILQNSLLGCDVLEVNWENANGMNYNETVERVQMIGSHIADMVQALVSQSVTLTLSKVHMIGSGMGAHIAAAAARDCTGVIGRITGLDPINWRFTATMVLQQADAAFVDLYYSARGLFSEGFYGSILSTGHVVININGGIQQPNCLSTLFPANVWQRSPCSHRVATQLFAAASSLLSTVAAAVACPGSTVSLPSLPLGCLTNTLALGTYCVSYTP